jgi:hypothetical protein
LRGNWQKEGGQKNFIGDTPGTGVVLFCARCLLVDLGGEEEVGDFLEVGVGGD